MKTEKRVHILAISTFFYISSFQVSSRHLRNSKKIIHKMKGMFKIIYPSNLQSSLIFNTVVVEREVGERLVSRECCCEGGDVRTAYLVGPQRQGADCTLFCQ